MKNLSRTRLSAVLTPIATSMRGRRLTQNSINLPGYVASPHSDTSSQVDTRHEEASSPDSETPRFSMPPDEVVDPETASVPITVTALVNSVTRIDALAHQLDAEVYLELSWCLRKSPAEVDLDTEWAPELAFSNCIAEQKNAGRLKILGKIPNSAGHHTKMARSWCVQGTFICYFDLRKFPFDSHQFNIQIISYLPYAKVMGDTEPDSAVETFEGSVCNLGFSSNSCEQQPCEVLYTSQKYTIEELDTATARDIGTLQTAPQLDEANTFPGLHPAHTPANSNEQPLQHIKRLNSTAMNMMERPIRLNSTLKRSLSGRKLLPGRIEFKMDMANSAVKKRDFVLKDTWDLSSHVLLTGGCTEEDDAEQGGVLFPTLCIGVCVTRHHQFYHWNVMLPTAMFVAVPFITVLMEPDDVNSRLEVIVGMLLTVVAFKFVINAYIPAISYLTLMDKYLISGTCILFFMVVQVAFNKVLFMAEVEVSTVRMFDRVMIGVVALCWAILNLDYTYTQGAIFGILNRLGGERRTSDSANVEALPDNGNIKETSWAREL